MLDKNEPALESVKQSHICCNIILQLNMNMSFNRQII